jgi:hypothetical protein
LADSALQRAHLNLIDSSRQFFELDAGARIDGAAGWLFGAGTASHPVISNAAFRRDDRLDGNEFIERAQHFFSPLSRGFSVWVRAEQGEDRDLTAAAEEAGLKTVYGMPEMVLRERLEPVSPPPDVELSQLSEPGHAPDFWRVAKAAYATNGFPPEVFAGYTRHEGLLAENVATFVAYLDDEPVSIAMTIVSQGVAGIYWVGSVEAARGKGLGRAVTVAATNAGFDLGADIAALQASPMGEPIYLSLGYETAFEYQLMMSPAP